MDAETLKALRESIEHWERNVAAKHPRDAHIKSGSCPLCAVHLNPPEPPVCGDCPVRQATGRDGCWDTPWHDVARHLEFWKDNPDGKYLRSCYVAAAQRELDFLRALVPAGADA